MSSRERQPLIGAEARAAREEREERRRNRRRLVGVVGLCCTLCCSVGVLIALSFGLTPAAPTPAPTPHPPTLAPTAAPTVAPTSAPTPLPTTTSAPTASPTASPTVMPVVRGSCCFSEPLDDFFGCFENMTADVCTSLKSVRDFGEGIFHANMACNDTMCSFTQANSQACCSLLGTCTNDLSPGECDPIMGGVYSQFERCTASGACGPGPPTPAPTPSPPGSCCAQPNVGSDVACFDNVNSDVCAAIDATPNVISVFEVGATCATSFCAAGQPNNRPCCSFLGTCTDDYTEARCALLGGVFSAGDTCTDTGVCVPSPPTPAPTPAPPGPAPPCGPTPPLGYCCTIQPGSNRTLACADIVTELECDNTGGTALRTFVPGETCDSISTFTSVLTGVVADVPSCCVTCTSPANMACVQPVGDASACTTAAAALRMQGGHASCVGTFSTESCAKRADCAFVSTGCCDDGVVAAEQCRDTASLSPCATPMPGAVCCIDGRCAPDVATCGGGIRQLFQCPGASTPIATAVTDCVSTRPIGRARDDGFCTVAASNAISTAPYISAVAHVRVDQSSFTSSSCSATNECTCANGVVDFPCGIVNDDSHTCIATTSCVDGVCEWEYTAVAIATCDDGLECTNDYCSSLGALIVCSSIAVENGTACDGGNGECREGICVPCSRTPTAAPTRAPTPVPTPAPTPSPTPVPFTGSCCVTCSGPNATYCVQPSIDSTDCTAVRGVIKTNNGHAACTSVFGTTTCKTRDGNGQCSVDITPFVGGCCDDNYVGGSQCANVESTSYCIGTVTLGTVCCTNGTCAASSIDCGGAQFTK